MRPPKCGSGALDSMARSVSSTLHATPPQLCTAALHVLPGAHWGKSHLSKCMTAGLDTCAVSTCTSRSRTCAKGRFDRSKCMTASLNPFAIPSAARPCAKPPLIHHG
eukprot:455786-Pelagomonas_calceolata.AAC.4